MKAAATILLGCLAAVSQAQLVSESFDSKTLGSDLAPRNGAGQAVEVGPGTWFGSDGGAAGSPDPVWKVSNAKSVSPNQSLLSQVGFNGIAEADAVLATPLPDKTNLKYSAEVWFGQSTPFGGAGITLGGRSGFLGELVLFNDGTVSATGSSGFAVQAFRTGGAAATFTSNAWNSLEIDLSYASGSAQVSYLLNGSSLLTSGGSLLSYSRNTTLSPNDFGVETASDGSATTTAYYDDIRAEAVPEPATVALLGLGVLAFFCRRG